MVRLVGGRRLVDKRVGGSKKVKREEVAVLAVVRFVQLDFGDGVLEKHDGFQSRFGGWLNEQKIRLGKKELWVVSERLFCVFAHLKGALDVAVAFFGDGKRAPGASKLEFLVVRERQRKSYGGVELVDRKVNVAFAVCDCGKLGMTQARDVGVFTGKRLRDS